VRCRHLKCFHDYIWQYWKRHDEQFLKWGRYELLQVFCAARFSTMADLSLLLLPNFRLISHKSQKKSNFTGNMTETYISTFCHCYHMY
jgi:hypothetical protein